MTEEAVVVPSETFHVSMTLSRVRKDLNKLNELCPKVTKRAAYAYDGTSSSVYAVSVSEFIGRSASVEQFFEFIDNEVKKIKK